MARPEATPAVSAAADLGPGGEEEWARLRTLLELERGRWLGFLFTGSPIADWVLRARTDQVLRRTAAKRVQVIEPATPDDLRSLLEGLFQPLPDGIGCRWVSAVHTDPGEGPGDWAAAWEHLLLRLNDRRDALLRVNRQGLMFAATEQVKRVGRDGAPDLWAMRNMVLEVPSGSPTAVATSSRGRLELPPRQPEASTADATTEPLDRPSIEVRDALREVSRQLSLGANDEAVRLTQYALRSAESQSERALAHAWLSRAQEADGDNDQAVESAIEALSTGTYMDDELAGRIDRIGPEIGGEAAALGALVSHADRVRRQESDPSRLSVALDQTGRLRYQLGDLAAAADDFAEALALNRRRLDRNPTSESALRDLSVSLERVGDTDLALGDTAAARSAYQESLQLARRLLDLHGDTPQALRDLTVSLNKVGDTDLALGDTAAARSAYQESLQLARRLLDLYGDNPQALGDLTVIQDKLKALDAAVKVASTEIGESDRGGPE